MADPNLKWYHAVYVLTRGLWEIIKMVLLLPFKR